MFLKLIKVHLLVSELTYIRMHGATIKLQSSHYRNLSAEPVGRSGGSLEIRRAHFGNSCSTAFTVNVLHGECISTGNGSASIGNDFVTRHCRTASRIWPLTLICVWFCCGSKYLVTYLNRNWCDNLGCIYVFTEKDQAHRKFVWRNTLRKLQIACAVKTNWTV